MEEPLLPFLCIRSCFEVMQVFVTEVSPWWTHSFLAIIQLDKLKIVCYEFCGGVKQIRYYFAYKTFTCPPLPGRTSYSRFRNSVVEWLVTTFDARLLLRTTELVVWLCSYNSYNNYGVFMKVRPPFCTCWNYSIGLTFQSQCLSGLWNKVAWPAFQNSKLLEIRTQAL